MARYLGKSHAYLPHRRQRNSKSSHDQPAIQRMSAIERFYVLIYLQVVSAEKIQRFFECCRTQPLITYTIKALGEWDYELNVEVADVGEFRALMKELTREFSDIVRQYYALPVSDIHKFMIMPPGAVYGE